MAINEVIFAQFLTDFIAHRARHGKDVVPDEASQELVHNFQECDLSNWIAHMNQGREKLNKHQESEITQQHVNILNEIGFPWIRSNEERWNDNFLSLLKFREETGHCNVPAKDDTVRLGKWVLWQRHKYKDMLVDENKSAMAEERIQKLESIGFNWGTRIGDWNTRYGELKEYAEAHGTCAVSLKVSQPLHRWIKKQRQRYRVRKHACDPKKARSSPITDEQIQKLEEIGFSWAPERTKKKEDDPRLPKKRSRHGACGSARAKGRAAETKVAPPSPKTRTRDGDGGGIGAEGQAVEMNIRPPFPEKRSRDGDGGSIIPGGRVAEIKMVCGQAAEIKMV